MPYGIKLQRLEIDSANHAHLGVWRCRVEAVDPVGEMDPNIFLFRRHPLDPHTGLNADKFITVATIADLSIYPVDDPDPGNSRQFYRTDVVELDFESQSDYLRFWVEIQRIVRELVSGLILADNLIVAEEVQIGDLP